MGDHMLRESKRFPKLALLVVETEFRSPILGIVMFQMYEVLQLKFKSYPGLEAELLDTGEADLVLVKQPFLAGPLPLYNYAHLLLSPPISPFLSGLERHFLGLWPGWPRGKSTREPTYETSSGVGRGAEQAVRPEWTIELDERNR